MLRVTANNQKIARPREPDIEPFLRTIAPRLLVDRQHDDTAFEPLEAEDVAVENLLFVPEGIPIGFGPFGLTIGLLGVPRTGGEHGDVRGFPALFEELVDDVIRTFESLVIATGLEPNGRPIGRAS